MTYLGHMPDGSSIQRHSAGGAYPYVVQVRDNPAGGYWWELIGPGIDNLKPGAALRFGSQDDLDAAVRRLLAVRENEDAWAFEVERLQTVSGQRVYAMAQAAGLYGDAKKTAWARMSRVDRVWMLLSLGLTRNTLKLPPGDNPPVFAALAARLV